MTITLRDPKPDPLRITAPVWELSASAPSIATGTLVDPKLHAIRVISQDATATELAGGVYFEKTIRQEPDPSEQDWPFDNGTKVKKPADALLPRLLLTFPASDNKSTITLRFSKSAAGKTSMDGGIKINDPRQAIVFPVPKPDENWPKLEDLAHFYSQVGACPNEPVALPKCQLVAGDITCKLTPSSDAGKLLTSIGWDGSDLQLTPDGIVVHAKVPFPSRANGLHGTFLLYSLNGDFPFPDTGLRLHLLSDSLSATDFSDWAKAWVSVSPTPMPGSSLEIVARPSALPPPFVWTIVWKSNTTWKLGDEIEVPKASVVIFVVGRRTESGLPDGSAQLLAERVTLSKDGSSVALKCSGGAMLTTQLTIKKAAAQAAEVLAIGDGSKIPLAHDARELSQTLSVIQGGDKPLYGFVAADRGWLQLPLPSIPPLTPQLDQNLAQPQSSQEPSVMDGFLRWSASVDPVLVSGVLNTQADLAKRSPWSLTVEQAGGFSVTASLTTTETDPQDPAVLASWTVALGTPTISMRGLLWLSGDRPGAEDALPRIGAGPGTFFDLAFRMNGVPISDDGNQATFSLESISVDLTKPDLQGVSLLMQRKAPDPDDAKTWAWLRHDRLPLAAAMPMTRSGGENTTPLESRELAPFIVTDAETQLTFHAGSVLADTSGTHVVRNASWPWIEPVVDKEPVGVAFAAVGVPGVEVQPAQQGWSKLEIGTRYDLPLLDEAFATAKLPKDEDAPSSKPPISPDPPVTALDRKDLGDFWQGRKRKQELTRIADSYFLPLGNPGKVKNLIASGEWDVTAALTMPGTADPLPYGRLDLSDGGTIQSQGDDALAGVNAKFKLANGKLTRDQNGALQVRGFSPSTFENNGLIVDNRDFASAPEKDITNARTRAVVVDGKAKTLLTMLQPYKIKVGNNKTLELWVKDLPIENKTFSETLGVEFDVWTAEKAPVEGYEVRLYDKANPGDERIRLWSFDLVFLGLISATFDDAFAAKELVLVCRLQLPAADDPLKQGGHVIELHVGPTQDGFVIKKLVPLQMPPVGLKNDELDRLMQLSFAASMLGTDKLALDQAQVKVTLFGASWVFDLKPVMLDPEGDAIAFEWKGPDGPDNPSSADGFNGRLIPRTVGLTLKDTAATLTRSFELRIEDRAAVALAVLPNIGTSADNLAILGYSVKTTASAHALDDDRAGAFICQLGPDVTMSLLERFPENANRIAKGLLAVAFEQRTVASAKSLAVRSGHIELDVAMPPMDEKPGVAMRTVRIDFSGSNSSQWGGHVELYGTFSLGSAIRWPANWQVTPPASGTKPVAVKTTGDGFITHRATVQLEGQRLAIDDLAGSGKGTMLNRLAAPWNVVALVNHELHSMSGKQICRWSSLEPFTLMILENLAALQESTFTGNNPHAEAAFVAGHRIPPGSQAQNDKSFIPVGAIFKPGFGRRADVLSGAFSRPFREALRKVIDTNSSLKIELVAAGGFAGVVLKSDGTTDGQRLLRVPYLARLHAVDADPPMDVLGPDSLTQMPDAGFDGMMPFHDTTSAPVLGPLSVRHSVTPANTRAETLLTLLSSGSVAPFKEGETVETAVLSEQAFVAGAFGKNAPLTKTPFWIGAALAIAELMGSADDQHVNRRAFSLIAGRISSDGRIWRPTSAIVALDPAAARAAVVPPLRRALITIGDTLVILEPFTAAGSPPAFLRIASANHTVPRVVVLRDDKYTIVPVPAPAGAELPPPAVFAGATAVFPKAQRGYPRPPFDTDGTAAALGWCAGVVQGETAPIFDRNASGVAGLATRVALPRYAHKIDVANEAASPLVWFGEKRAGPYLPLNLKALNAPPIAWLNAAPPRARLPLSTDVQSALAKAGVEMGNDATARAALPDSAALASVSERAGVLTDRRVQLLAHAPGTTAFDPSVARFGIAAQASGAPLRQVRTPRPSALPPERLPHASLFQPKKIARFVRGSVESLSGTNTQAEWSALIAAMPATDAIVSNRWDGSVRLRAEFRYRKIIGSAVEPLQWLFEQDSGRKIKSQAWMRIGDAIVHFLTAKFENRSAVGDTGYTAEIVLNVGTDDRDTNGLLKLASALNSVPPPDVELYLLVHPDSKLPSNLPIDGDQLTLAQTAGDDLPGGDSRPPVTLVWPLAPVSAERGGLALRPITIAFGDPAYDEELTGEPLEQRTDLGNTSGLPSERGRLRAVLSVDRRAAEMNGKLNVMFDVRYERRRKDGDPSEDDLADSSQRPKLFLQMRVLPKIGAQRNLVLEPALAKPKIVLGQVQELSLAALREEKDGAPVRWQPGDRLSLSVTAQDGKLTITPRGASEMTVTLDSNAPLHVDVPVSAEPSFEPPSALYAVMKKIATTPTSLSIPLFSQSPQPQRVDAPALRDDIRRGLIRRRATFLWRSAWPIVTEAPSIYVVKQDRNGQTHLPKSPDEFAELESPSAWDGLS